jgi:hypothetical protein
MFFLQYHNPVGYTISMDHEPAHSLTVRFNNANVPPADRLHDGRHVIPVAGPLGFIIMTYSYITHRLDVSMGELSTAEKHLAKEMIKDIPFYLPQDFFDHASQ